MPNRAEGGGSQGSYVTGILRILAIHGAENTPPGTFRLNILQPERLLKI